MSSQAANVVVPGQPGPHNGAAQSVVSTAGVAQLRKKLGLLDGRCGSSSTKPWPCKVRSPAAGPGPEKTKVDGELLPAIVGLTQACPELRQKLNELVQNWHCKFHCKNDIRVGPRVATWLASFPLGSRTAGVVATSASTADPSIQKTSQSVPALVSPPTTPPPDRIITNKQPDLISGSPGPTRHPPARPDPALPSPPPTPGHRGLTVQKEATVVQELMARLGLDSGYCGSYRKQCEKNPDPLIGRRCRARPMSSLAGGRHKAEVEEILESLASLTPTSPDFETTLLRLAQKWQCQSHVGINYAEQRTREWLTLFPDGPTIAATSTEANTLEIARGKIRELLRPLTPRYCPVIVKRTSKQCRKSIGGRNVRHCDNLVDEIAMFAVELDDEELKVELLELDRVGRCSAHNGPEDVRVAMWLMRIRDITRALPNPVLQSLKKPGQNMHSRAMPSGHDESPLRIIHWSDEPEDLESIGQRIASKLQEPLTKKERKVRKGVLYVYTVPGNPQFIKIGYTSRTVALRHDEWQTDCDRRVVPVYPILPEDEVSVRYPLRVEALCHAELEHCRVRVDCGTCRVQHIEWFMVSARVAADVVRRWTRLMAENPHEII